VTGQLHALIRERAPGAHWIGGWVDPRASLVTVEKRKISGIQKQVLFKQYVVSKAKIADEQTGICPLCLHFIYLRGRKDRIH
jgi:hypothetical protein